MKHMFLLTFTVFIHLVHGKNYFIDIKPILNELDYVIATNSLPSFELLNRCSQALTRASIVLPDQLKTMVSYEEYLTYTIVLLLHRLKSEEIIQKLKYLSWSMSNEKQGFLRDTFRVISTKRNAKYRVEAIEYYSEVQFYPNSNHMMKLFEWKVYKLSSFNLTNEIGEDIKFIAQYNLEKSQSKDGSLTYVFGRTDIEDLGHVSIVNYGSSPGPEIDGYYQMKLLVIKDLKLEKGLPVLARIIRHNKVGISTVIVYGLQRRLQDTLGLEVDDNTLFDDDTITHYDTETGRKIKNSEP